MHSPWVGVDLERPAPRVLVVLLALHPRGMSGDELAHTLGSDGSEVTLRAEIARLRRRLGPVIASQPYRLVADVHADFLEVDWLTSRGALAAAREAYVGPLLPASDVLAIAATRARSSGAVRAVPGARSCQAGLQPPATLDARLNGRYGRWHAGRRMAATKEGLHPMAIDFTLTNEQREVQANAREFAENVLAPVVRQADAEPDPLRGFQRTKEAYIAGVYRPIRRGSPSACCHASTAAGD